MEKKVRIAFYGSPELAAVCLAGLVEKQTVSLVVTRPDREVGRGRRVSQTPVSTVALDAGIPVVKPPKPDRAVLTDYRSYGIDLAVVVAYGEILPDYLTQFPRYGSLNLHASLLPRHRGASPIESSILSGDRITGLTLQLMESRMDAGDIVACRSTPIDPETTAEDLLKRYLREAPGFLMESIFDYVAGRVQPRPQNEREATYCAKISKSDGLIDWSADAEWISRKIRAFNLWPVCHTKLDGKLLRIYRARLNHGDGISSDTGIEEGGVRGETEPGRIVALERENGIIVQTGKGCIAVTELQLEHRRRMSHGEFANGYRGLAGKLLGGGGSGEERKS